MIHAASSMNVIDVSTGKLLLGLRFSGLPAALDYLSQASLVCSSCSKRFNSRSTVTMMNRGESWELMFPHDCAVPVTRLERVESSVARL